MSCQHGHSEAVRFLEGDFIALVVYRRNDSPAPNGAIQPLVRSNADGRRPLDNRRLGSPRRHHGQRCTALPMAANKLNYRFIRT